MKAFGFVCVYANANANVHVNLNATKITAAKHPHLFTTLVVS